MALTMINGDLIKLAEDGRFDVIVHGCNCFHAMGGGIARKIAKKYPVVEQVDKTTKYGDRSKLGTYTTAEVLSPQGNTFYVVNAYTQYNWSGREDVFEYEAFDRFLREFDNNFLGNLSPRHPAPVSVGFPKIGCGLARGDEARIMKSLETFSDFVRPWCEVAVVSFNPNLR